MRHKELQRKIENLETEMNYIKGYLRKALEDIGYERFPGGPCSGYSNPYICIKQKVAAFYDYLELECIKETYPTTIKVVSTRKKATKKSITS